MPDSMFPPTALDRALLDNPASTVMSREVEFAARRQVPQPQSVPTPEPDAVENEPTREGQLEIAAASLAAGMIAADGEHVTASEAVAKVRQVMKELRRD